LNRAVKRNREGFPDDGKGISSFNPNLLDALVLPPLTNHSSQPSGIAGWANADPLAAQTGRFWDWRNGAGRGYTRRQMSFARTVLWIYIVLLVTGGLIGYLKAGSRPSLIASVSFAAALTLCALNVIFQPYVADLLLAALLVVFGLRLSKTKKFMPSGLMLVLTLATLALRHLKF
jgi:uncharacterized membrane protein (UPF0136 family)